MTDLVAYLGLPGVLLAITSVVFVGYWATRPFRPEATWYSDLSQLCKHRRQSSRRKRRPLVMPHDLWPTAQIGPRAWRWPLNATRYVCALLWQLLANRRGLLGFVGRTAWYPATGLGAVAAITQGAVLTVVFSLPVAVVLCLVDSSTVIRGGIPPARRSHTRKLVATHQRHTQQAQRRYHQIRAHLQQQALTDPRGIGS